MTKEKKESRILKLITESALIIFSVLLALIISEWRNNYNQKLQTEKIISNIKEEIIENQKFIQTVIPYHEEVNKKIGMVGKTDSIPNQLFMEIITEAAPKGIFQGSFKDIAWTVANTGQISNRITLKKSTILYEVYEQQKGVNSTIQRTYDFLTSREVHRKELLDENVTVFKLLFNELTTQEKQLNYFYQNAIETLNENE